MIRDRARYGEHDPFFGELVGNHDAADGNDAEALGEAQAAGQLSPEPSDDSAEGKDGGDESSFMQGQSQQLAYLSYQIHRGGLILQETGQTRLAPSTLKSYQFSLKLFYLWHGFWSLT